MAIHLERLLPATL